MPLRCAQLTGLHPPHHNKMYQMDWYTEYIQQFQRALQSMLMTGTARHFADGAAQPYANKPDPVISNNPILEPDQSNLSDNGSIERWVDNLRLSKNDLTSHVHWFCSSGQKARPTKHAASSVVQSGLS